jgi:hypothetical protein
VRTVAVILIVDARVIRGAPPSYAAVDRPRIVVMMFPRVAAVRIVANPSILTASRHVTSHPSACSSSRVVDRNPIDDPISSVSGPVRDVRRRRRSASSSSDAT